MRRSRSSFRGSSPRSKRSWRSPASRDVSPSRAGQGARSPQPDRRRQRAASGQRAVGRLSLRTLVDDLLDTERPTAERPDPQALRHELNTPLNHIIGYTDLLLEEGADAAPQGFVADVERIRVAARQSLVLITRVLGPGAQPAPLPADPLNREILERHLTRQGYQVLMAKGGRQALEMLAAARVDVVLPSRRSRTSTASCAASRSAPRITSRSRSTRCC